jgi:L-cystine transport system substrate-binding protein
LTRDLSPSISLSNSDYLGVSSMFYLKKSIVFAAILSLLAFSAFGDDDLAKIKSADIIRIGTEGTYAPFTFHDASGTLVGFDVEIAQEVAKRLGVTAQFTDGKWDGLIAGLDANRYDAVFNEVSITKARKAKYDFSDPYILSKAALIVKSDNKKIKSFADLKGKKSAQTLTSNFAQIVKDNGGTVVGNDGFSQSIDLLLAGRVDATVNDNLSFLDFKTKKPDAKIKIVATLDDADRSGAIVRKGNPELVAAINKALADAKADGTYLKISQKYFGEDVSK